MTSGGGGEEKLHSSVHTSAHLTARFLLQREGLTVWDQFKVTRGDMSTRWGLPCVKMVCAWGRAIQVQLPPAMGGSAGAATSGPARGWQDAQI